MRPITVTVTPLDDADGIAEAQTLAGAEDVALDGVLVSNGTVTLSTAQNIVINSVGDDSGVIFTITGKNEAGVPITENLAGANATDAVSTNYFSYVSSIASDGATAGDITVGVLEASGGASTWIQTDWRQPTFGAGLGLVITGTCNATVQHSFNDPQNTTSPTWFDNSGLTGKTSNDDGNYIVPVRIVRLKVTSATSGSASLTYIQAIGD